jgi:peptidoglycan/LPS O-acetylase OafA/YrhL
MKEDQRINSLKGLLVLLIVFHHVAGPGRRTSTPALDLFDQAISFARMPLFVVISGYLFGLPKSGPFSFKRYLSGRLKRLLVPTVICFAAAQSLSTGLGLKHRGGPWWHFPFISYAHLGSAGSHLWYAQSLFFALIGLAALESRELLASKRRCISLLVATSLVQVFALGKHREYLMDQIAPDWLSAWGLIYMLPFLLFGLCVARFEWLTSIRLRTLAMVSVAIAIANLPWNLSRGLAVPDDGEVLTLLGGFGASVLAFQYMPVSSILSALGRLALPMYLLHPFALAFAYQAARWANLSVNQTWILPLLIWALGVPLALISAWRLLVSFFTVQARGEANQPASTG